MNNQEDFNRLSNLVNEMFDEGGVMKPCTFVDNSQPHMFMYDNSYKVAVLEFAAMLEEIDEMTTELLVTAMESAQWTKSYIADNNYGNAYLWDTGKDLVYVYMFSDYSFNMYSIQKCYEHPYLRYN